MQCQICSLPNEQLIAAIEQKLSEGNGYLTIQAKNQLIKAFPEHKEAIKALDDQSCSVHFNFHQKVTLFPNFSSTGANGNNDEQTTKTNRPGSIAGDIKKNEASILYDTLNMQAATLTALNNAINESLTKQLKEGDGDLKQLILHPETRAFYKELTDSIRSTAKELREMHATINGEKDPSVDGLKAIAEAIHGPSVIINTNGASISSNASKVQEGPDEMTTTIFDD